MPVQSVIFDKDFWTIKKSKDWLKKNKYKIKKIHTTDEYHRFRQLPPTFNRYRTISLPNNIKLIYGFN